MKRLFTLLLLASAAFAQDYTTTPNLGLKLPKQGSTNWGPYVNQDFTTLDAAVGQFKGGFVTVPFSATPVFNLTLGNTFQLTLSGNVTSSTVNQPGITAGQLLYLIVCQDGSGNRIFTFPASFLAPLPSVTVVGNQCTATTWIWSAPLAKWVSTGAGGGGGGGGGGNPGAPNLSLQYNNGGVLGGSNILFTSPGTYSSTIDTSISLLSSDSLNSISLSADSNIPATPGGAAFIRSNVSAAPSAYSFVSATAIGGTQTGGNCYGGGAGSPPCAVGGFFNVGDLAGDTNNGQDAVGADVSLTMSKTSGSMNNVSGVAILTPRNALGGSIAETATNLWGVKIQDLGGFGTTDQAAIKIDSQTAGSGTSYAIEASSGSGLSLLNDGVQSSFFRKGAATPAAATGDVRLPNNESVCWRNFGGSGDNCITSNASDLFNFSTGITGTGSTGTLTLGTGATNTANTWTANQTLSNGTELRFISSDLSHYAGFKGGASVSNLVWLFPTTDSSGTQCLASNGSLQLSWSACSAGTGTPGGATTNVQYNNSGSFAGSGNFTFDGTGLVGIGLANTTLGKLKLFGSTSGDVTIQPQAVAGTATVLTAPNTTGTIADGASVPLVLSVTTGNLTCPTCTTNAAALTANRIVLGGGAQATTVLGSLGTTTTLLHGNAAGAPTFGAVGLTTDVTGVLPVANGGTSGATAAAGFDALAPTTTQGDLIIRGASSNVRLPIGAIGTCLVSNGTTAAYGSCASGTVGGSATAGQGTFWTGTGTIGGSSNWLYSSSSGHSTIQGANNTDLFYGQRFTDSAPTGNLFHFQNAAANADVAKLDVNGNLTISSVTFNGAGAAGAINLLQGTTPALIANTVQLVAPTSVAAGGIQYLYPGTPASGFIRWTNLTGTETGALTTASGTGACVVGTYVTTLNDNAVPTCSPLVAGGFSSQAANTFVAAPSGVAGLPTFRTIVNADLPAIVLTSGVTGTLPIANGGTNATTASAAFNNLSPMTAAGSLIYGGTSGAGTELVAGTANQVLHSGTTPSWGAVALATQVSGTLPIANGGTGQTTAGAAFNALAPAASANAVLYATGSNTWGQLPAGNGCLQEVSSGTPTWGTCGGAGGANWDTIGNPGSDLSLLMGTNNTLFTWGVMVSARNAFEMVDGASTSTGSLLSLHTGATSTMKPLTVTAKGTANGVQMSNVGSLGVIGTGHIVADQLSRTITTTTPLTIGGGASADLTADRTLACSTCVTSSSALSNGAIVLGSGGGQGSATDANITSTGAGVLTIANTATNTVPLTVNAPTAQTSDLLDLKVNGTRQFYVTNTGGFVGLGNSVLGGTLNVGTNGGTGGALTLNGATSGACTINVASTGGLGLGMCGTSVTPANLVVASSPGAGIAHFAGSTQTVTSSSIVAADITSGTITGTQIASSVALAGTPTVTAGSITGTVASGTSAMGTASISSGACATVVTTSATGTATTDVIQYTPNADPTVLNGYGVSSTGSLYIWAYPTANNVNFKVCNNTANPITPSALTLNWRVVR